MCRQGTRRNIKTSASNPGKEKINARNKPNEVPRYYLKQYLTNVQAVLVHLFDKQTRNDIFQILIMSKNQRILSFVPIKDKIKKD